jgi:hypothetical protein
MDEIFPRYGIKPVRVHDPRKFLQGIACGFFFGELVKVSENRAVFRDAGEGGFDFLDCRIGKETAGDSVAVLLERGFHFIQID